MIKVFVYLKDRSYPIFIGNKLFEKDKFSWKFVKPGDQILIVTDDYVAPIYLDKLYDTLFQLKVTIDYLVIPNGEKSKSLNMLNRIFTKLLQKNCNRDVILLALGGGVIGDLTGFAASVYQRGVRFIQVPTTLLSQVDASVGGKTGINHILGKNMIGSFHQPIFVLINLDCLNTLKYKEFSSGLAEVIKYAVAFDKHFFSWLENYLDDILNLNLNSLTYCVRRCCELKANIISFDEKDKNVRNFLNFGHTYGHAIESFLKYVEWSHGEAISAGMIMASNTAIRLGEFCNIDFQRIKNLLLRVKLPICGPKNMKVEDYLSYMIRDKKSVLGKNTLILPTAIGEVKTFFDIKNSVIQQSIEDSYRNSI